MRGFIRRRFAVAVSVAMVAWGNVARAEGSLDWDPARTWVFAVGLLEWEREDLWAPFPAAMIDRRDEQLVDYFRDAGVDEDRINYLQDSDATKADVEAAFVEMLDETEEGDLLVFYFCGHGHRDRETGGTWFATYDAGDENSSGWSVRRIFSTIEAHFSGDRVLMLADCCHSGALYDEARRRAPDSDISYAVLTSSYAHNLSTGNWTFSDSVLAGLRGEGQCDLNGDEVVDLQEMSRYAELELAFVEGQKSMFHAAKEFPRRAVLAEVEEAIEPGAAQRLEVEWKGKWYRAKALDRDGDQLYVHYLGFEDRWDEWVGPERMRAYQPAQYAEGDRVEVCWEIDDNWYPATVVRGWYGLHHVRYDGFDASSDEWVGPGRVRLRGE